MKPLTHALSAALISVAALAAALPAFAQDKPRTAMVAIYHVAPGKQLEFLKWMAAREDVDTQAGVAATHGAAASGAARAATAGSSDRPVQSRCTVRRRRCRYARKPSSGIPARPSGQP